MNESKRSRTLLEGYYRPQTKFAKVMFSQVSVCPQGRGSGPLHAGIHPPGQTNPLGRHPPGRHPWADTHPPWADTHTPGQTPPTPGQTPRMHSCSIYNYGKYENKHNLLLGVEVGKWPPSWSPNKMRQTDNLHCSTIELWCLYKFNIRRNLPKDT